MLSACESTGTHSLRLNLTRQLAEVLIRGFTGSNYTPPSTNGIYLYINIVFHSSNVGSSVKNLF